MKTRQRGRIKLDHSTEQIVMTMCEGNPGALNVIIQLLKEEASRMMLSRSQP